MTFYKRPDQPCSAAAEAAGLRWLREASNMVIEVLEADDEYLVLPRVQNVRATPAAARQAGRELARIHDAGAEAFGSPPPGWDGPNYIGTQRQACNPTDSWKEYYTHQRVLPFAHKAHRRGHLSTEDLTLVQRVLEALPEYEGEPARLHGDLWAGNLLYGPEGAVVIDPAAHGGHREMDLAMLDLFGTDYLEEIRRGYEEVHPLPEGWLAWTPMHQLHPLAVHAASHGPSYGHALARAARETLVLLD